MNNYLRAIKSCGSSNLVIENEEQKICSSDHYVNIVKLSDEELLNHVLKIREKLRSNSLTEDRQSDDTYSKNTSKSTTPVRSMW